MHGVSHAMPGDDNDIEPPPPVHYGIDQALKNGSVALNARRQASNQQQQQENVKNFFSNEDLRNVGRSGRTEIISKITKNFKHGPSTPINFFSWLIWRLLWGLSWLRFAK